MKYNITLKIYGVACGSLIKNKVSKDVLKQTKKEYRNIMTRASDIGKNNMLLSAYSLAAFFIAMNRCNKIDVNDNYLMLEAGMKTSKILKLAMGNSKSYLSEKRNKKRKKWALETQKKIYKNDWVVEIKDNSEYYELDYYECGVCKLCKDEGCFEYAKYLCKLDYLLADIMGLKLHRTMTLANGDKYCDFKYYRR